MDWFFIVCGVLVLAVSAAMYAGAGGFMTGWLTKSYTEDSIAKYRRAQLPGGIIFGIGGVIEGIWVTGIGSWIGWIVLAVGLGLSIAEGRCLQVRPEVRARQRRTENDRRL